MRGWVVEHSPLEPGVHQWNVEASQPASPQKSRMSAACELYDNDCHTVVIFDFIFFICMGKSASLTYGLLPSVLCDISGRPDMSQVHFRIRTNGVHYWLGSLSGRWQILAGSERQGTVFTSLGSKIGIAFGAGMGIGASSLRI